MVLPWPGDSACIAPQPNAAGSRRSRTPRPAAASSSTPAKPSPPERSAVAALRRPSGASTVPAPGVTRRVASRTSAGVSSSAGIDRQPPRRIVGGDRRAHGGAAPRRGDDRAPPDAAGERAVAQHDGARRLDRRVRAQHQTRVVSAALPGAAAQLAAGRQRQRHGLPVDRERERARHLGPLARQERAARERRAPGTSGSPPGRARSARRPGRSRPRPTARWLTEKLPSGCASAAAGDSAARPARATQQQAPHRCTSRRSRSGSAGERRRRGSSARAAGSPGRARGQPGMGEERRGRASPAPARAAPSAAPRRPGRRG